MDYLVIFVVLAVVVLVVSAPLRSRHSDEAAESAERAELEAARDAKYREIRDAELDYRTGKLSESDWRAIDRGLRAEAVEILRALDDHAGRELVPWTGDAPVLLSVVQFFVAMVLIFLVLLHSGKDAGHVRRVRRRHRGRVHRAAR